MGREQSVLRSCESFPTDTSEESVDSETESDHSSSEEENLYSTGERIRGTKASAILLKWHIKTNHINKKYLFQLADRIDGMEELRRLSKKTPRNSKKRDLTAGSIDFMEI
mmetsp:Transcript_17319/g.57372  ORF Transcript_17319/g.57372 Transcript_17319/m.57372 type:complete len:110 (-) Transcript_17319:3274-3603(-)